MLEHVIRILFQNGHEDPSNVSRHTVPATVCLAKKKGPNTLFGQGAKHVKLWNVSHMFRDFVRIVAPPQIVSLW